MHSKSLRATSFIALVMAAMLACALSFVVASPTEAHAANVTTKTVTAKGGKYTVKVKQNKVDYRTVNVKLKSVKALKKAGVKKVQVTAYMTYGKKTVSKKSKTVKLSTVDKKTNTFTFGAPAYGLYTVKVKFCKSSGKTIKTKTLKKVPVVAQEYNIGDFNGTFGPLYYSLSLWDKSVVKGKAGNPIPSIIALSRDDSYNWKKLPANTFACPLVKSPKTGNFVYKTQAMSDYVGQLKKANKNSKFHFYFADNFVQGVFDVITPNKIKRSNYDVTFITDGSGSYYWFNSVYSKANAQSVHNGMVKEWQKLLAKAESGKKVKAKDLKYGIGGKQLGMSKYTYAAVCGSSNIKWWVSRTSGTFQSADANFLATAISKMEVKNMNDMLNTLKDTGKASAFKKLYHFSDNMFAAAKKNNKKVMILMGTRVNLEKNFAEFAKFVKKAYGSSYEYYYKGHPATPTKLYSSKQKELKSVGVTDIESSIPAELILFFNPDVYVSGMSNSTLNQAYKAGHTKVYLGTRIANKDSIMSGDLFEMFFTKIDSSYEAPIKNLCPSGHTCFLVEYKGSKDIGIYDAKTNTITKYAKQSNGTYIKKK